MELGALPRAADQGNLAKVWRRRLRAHGEQQQRAGAATLHRGEARGGRVPRAGGGEERGDRGYQQADGERRQGAGRRCPGGSRHVIKATHLVNLQIHSPT